MKPPQHPHDARSIHISHTQGMRAEVPDGLGWATAPHACMHACPRCLRGRRLPGRHHGAAATSLAARLAGDGWLQCSRSRDGMLLQAAVMHMAGTAPWPLCAATAVKGATWGTTGGLREPADTDACWGGHRQAPEPSGWHGPHSQGCSRRGTVQANRAGPHQQASAPSSPELDAPIGQHVWQRVGCGPGGPLQPCEVPRQLVGCCGPCSRRHAVCLWRNVLAGADVRGCQAAHGAFAHLVPPSRGRRAAACCCPWCAGPACAVDKAGRCVW